MRQPKKSHSPEYKKLPGMLLRLVARGKLSVVRKALEVGAGIDGFFDIDDLNSSRPQIIDQGICQSWIMSLRSFPD